MWSIAQRYPTRWSSTRLPKVRRFRIRVRVISDCYRRRPKASVDSLTQRIFASPYVKEMALESKSLPNGSVY